MEKIIILDFGSQYCQLIARRIRECHVYSEIVPFDTPAEVIAAENPRGIILSGGPASVYAENAPRCDKNIFALDIPILGICYGLQLILHALGGEIQRSSAREYGNAELKINSSSGLFENIPPITNVWMSHGDKAVSVPGSVEILASSENTPYCAVKLQNREIYGIQFHPEVAHSPHGKQLLANFCKNICHCSGNWTMENFIDNSIAAIRESVGSSNVILGLSGGVDSSVAAALIHRAIGDQLHCIFVDNGLLRKNEARRVQQLFADTFHIKLTAVNAEKRFLNALKGITEPEAKRKIIGNLFVEVFNDAASQIAHADFLAQGTTYPDVIESVSIAGNPSALIKSHHNVGGLPEKMPFKLLEPLRTLFKDEVRLLGKALGLPDDAVMRQPFPGPGLAVRHLGEVSKETLEILRNADEIVVSEIKQAGLYYKLWQTFAVFLPIKSVGVMGDERSYDYCIALRIVESSDGMTADWYDLPPGLIRKISSRITNEVAGVNRVVYDVTSKPPATIEWE